MYEVLDQVGSGFMQISKSCVVNLSYVQSVEAGFGGSLLLKMRNGLSDYVSRAGFGGSLLLKMRNGLSDYVSRKYLPDLKNYLGLDVQYLFLQIHLDLQTAASPRFIKRLLTV